MEIDHLVGLYLQLRLYEHDFAQALATLRAFRRVRSTATKQILVRDFVVSYSRPFSGNRDSLGRKHRLYTDRVPGIYLPLHESIIAARNQLFAHTDWHGKQPQLADFTRGDRYWFPMSFKPAKYAVFLGRIAELRSLTRELVSAVTREYLSLEPEIHRLNSEENNGTQKSK